MRVRYVSMVTLPLAVAVSASALLLSTHLQVPKSGVIFQLLSVPKPRPKKTETHVKIAVSMNTLAKQAQLQTKGAQKLKQQVGR